MTKKKFITYLLAGTTLANLAVNAFSEVVFGGAISNQLFAPKNNNDLLEDFKDNNFYLIKKDEDDNNIKLIKLTSDEVSKISKVIDTTRSVDLALK